MVKSACGIEAAYMCFDGTGIWGGETITVVPGHLIKINATILTKTNELPWRNRAYSE